MLLDRQRRRGYPAPPSRRPTRGERNLQRPLPSRFHHHNIADPILQRGTRWAVLLDGFDTICHLPEERMHRLERHRLAIVRDTPLGPRPREPFANDMPRLAREFHMIGVRKDGCHSAFREQPVRVEQDQCRQFAVDAVMHWAEQPTPTLAGSPQYQRHRSIRWVPTPLKAQELASACCARPPVGSCACVLKNPRV